MIYVSISTIPPRIKNLEKSVESILNQTLKPDKIFINIPFKYRRFKEAIGDNQLPNFKDSSIEVTRCEDCGPGTKLLGSVHKMEKDSLVVLADDDNFYDFEYKMLRLAGITDMDNASYEEMKTKMSFLWKLHSNDFQCPLATNIYPNGNFLRQLARADGEDAFELVLDNYGFDPNVIDPDGCAVFDYLDAQITSDHSYAKILIEKFKKYKAILLKYDAKTANEICGCTKC